MVEKGGLSQGKSNTGRIELKEEGRHAVGIWPDRRRRWLPKMGEELIKMATDDGQSLQRTEQS